MSRSRLITGLLAAMCAGALAGCPQTPAKPFPHAIMTPSPKPMPATTLVDGAGQPFTLASLQGKWVWLYFGFANCPDVCPAAMDFMAAEYKRLKAPEQVQAVFVSVDPKRDTPDKLKPFATYYHPSFIGLTGDKAAIDALAKSVGAGYVIDPPATPGGSRLEGGADRAGGEYDYNVSHSNLVFVVDPAGHYVATYVPGANPGDMAADFDALAAQKR